MFLSDKLKYFMAVAQVSSTQLANNINVSPTTISEILNGIRSNPRPETIHTLAKYFNVDISEFYDDEINKELISIKHTNKKIFFPSIKVALSHLLIKTGIISTASLHKLSGIPKHNLDRILNEETVTPNMKTLQQIANFFNLTVTQLTGLEPIYFNESQSINLEQKMIPLIRLGELSAWLNGDFKNKIEYINVARKVIGEKAFAILIDTEELEPDFDNNTIVVIDNESVTNNKDFIITTIKNTPSIYEVNENKLRKAGTISYFNKPSNIDIHGVIIQEIINKKGC